MIGLGRGMGRDLTCKYLEAIARTREQALLILQRLFLSLHLKRNTKESKRSEELVTK